jgi:hypothetical protein
MNAAQRAEAQNRLSLGFSGTSTSLTMNVMRSALRYAVGKFRSFVNISDAELDHVVTGFVDENPLSGERHTPTRLRASGIVI